MARAVRMMCIAIVALAIAIDIVIGIGIDIDVIVTSAEGSSEPVAKEQCCRQQNMNYVIVALTTHYSTNCSQSFIHNFNFRVNLTWSWPGLGP